MLNLADIIKQRELRPSRQTESSLSNTLEDSLLANYGDEPFDFIPSTENALSTIAIAVSPNGETIATTHGDHTVKVFQLSSGARLRTFSGHPRTPWTVKYCPADPNIVASGCLGFEVRVWDILHGNLVNLLRLDSCVITLAFHPAGNLILASSGPRLHTWRWRQGASSDFDYSEATAARTSSIPSDVASVPAGRPRIISHSRNIRAVLFHPGGRFVFVAAPDPPICPDPSRSPTAANRLYGFLFDRIFALPPYEDHLPPIALIALPTVIPEIHLYSDGGIDVSRDGRYLITGALAYVRSPLAGALNSVGSVNTQGISAIEQLEHLPQFWTTDHQPDMISTSSTAGDIGATFDPNRGVDGAAVTEENTNAQSSSARFIATHSTQYAPRSFPLVAASARTSRQQTHSPVYYPLVDPAFTAKPIFFDPTLDRAETILGMRPQEMLCLFRIHDPGEACSDDTASRDGRGLSLVLQQHRDIAGSLMKAVTSVKFSPTARVAVLAFGVRRDGAVEDHPAKNAACEIIKFADELRSVNAHGVDSMRTVALIANTEDEVNIAQFHALPGAGIIYGTKQGKVRIFRHKNKS